jgi:hypothetical protein
MSTRVPLGDITGIQKGAYILSTLNNQTKDPVTNYGLSISFLVARQDTRVTSYSVRNRYNPEDAESRGVGGTSTARGRGGRTATLSHVLSKAYSAGKVGFVAFKSLPVDSSSHSGGQSTGAQKGTNNAPLGTPKESVDAIVTALVKACDDFGVVDGSFVKEEDVVRYVSASLLHLPAIVPIHHAYSPLGKLKLTRPTVWRKHNVRQQCLRNSSIISSDCCG